MNTISSSVSGSDNNLKKVACFIHSSTMNIRGTEVLEYIISYLKNVNFFDDVDFVYINNIGEPICHSKFSHISSKIIINNYSEDIALFELCTIRQLHFFSLLNPSYKILYLHTKGNSHNKHLVTSKNIQDWVNFLLYSLVDNRESCIDFLNTYDCVGSNYRYKTPECKCSHQDCNKLYEPCYVAQHYSGNFWWANADYIHTLSLLNLKGKFDAEWWLMKKNPHFLNIHTHIYGHYENPCKKDEYENIIKQNLEYYKKNKLISKSCNIINIELVGETRIELCNQLFKIVNCIFDIIQNKKYNKRTQLITITISGLNKDYKTLKDFYSVDDILDIDYINNYLKKYNIIILPENKFNLEITKVDFGLLGINTVDITDKVKEIFMKNDNYLYIPRYINLNGIKGDPIPNLVKNVYIHYKINNSIYFITHPENSYYPLEINVKNTDIHNKELISNSTLSSESIKNIFLFNDILNNFMLKNIDIDLDHIGN